MGDFALRSDQYFYNIKDNLALQVVKTTCLVLRLLIGVIRTLFRIEYIDYSGNDFFRDCTDTDEEEYLLTLLKSEMP